MYLNQIEAFVAIVKYKSFSKAANQLYLSQPTISAYIKSLEADLGIQLISRTTKDVILTEAGATFYKYALDILQVRDSAYQKMQHFSKELAGTITIAASTFSSQYILPDMVAKATATHPELHFHILQMDNRSIIESVENSDVDFGIGESNASKSVCRFDPLIEEKLILITPNTPKYQALNGFFPPNIFTAEPFILQYHSSVIRNCIVDYFQEINISNDDMNIVAEMSSPFGICQAVREGMGISIVTEKTAEDFLHFGHCLAFDLDSKNLSFTVSTVCNPYRKLTSVANYFYQFLFQ